jgi:diguanylate cyclase (GGDEF)-like protein
VQVLELPQKDHVDIAEIARVISRIRHSPRKFSARLTPALWAGQYHQHDQPRAGAAGSAIGENAGAGIFAGGQSLKTKPKASSTSITGGAAFIRHRGRYWPASCNVQQEECFLGALLMDIGMLVLDQVLGEQYGNVHDTAGTHQLLAEAERKAFSMTHAEASGVLAEQWKLPPVLAVPMAAHDHPKDVTDPALKTLAEIVSISGRARMFVDQNPADAVAFVRKAFAESFQIAEADCDAMMNEISIKTKEVASLFEVNISDGANYEAVLKRANETLDLTLRSQQQAEKLQKQNMKLKEQAATDSLTGLGNRASFDQFLSNEFATALNLGLPISLLMIDVDHFKKINDQFGHPIGDQVLKTLGQILKSAAGPADMAVRYGGEELALVMPNTTKLNAAAAAKKSAAPVCARPMVSKCLRPRLCEHRCCGHRAPPAIQRGCSLRQGGRPGCLCRQESGPQLREGFLHGKTGKQRGVTNLTATTDY